MSKILTVSEALIALGNGEKITSVDMGGNGEFISYRDDDFYWKNGERCEDLGWTLKIDSLRIYQELTYPMWFENISPYSDVGIVKFLGLKHRIDLDGRNEYTTSLPHTDTDTWQQVEEPKKKIKVAKYAFAAGKQWMETTNYYKDDMDFKDARPKKGEFKRLDYTEIEVEEY
jgi:hypothetical protein